MDLTFPFEGGFFFSFSHHVFFLVSFNVFVIVSRKSKNPLGTVEPDLSKIGLPHKFNVLCMICVMRLI